VIRNVLQRGVIVTVTVLLVTIFGIISLFRVPVQMTPDLAPTSLSILTSWPGATPQDIEREILVDKMTSTASTGRGEIVIEFKVGTDINEVLLLANNALAQVASYPENVDQPRIVTAAATDQPIAWFSLKPLPGNPRGVDIVAMQDFAEDFIQTRLEQTPGVSQSEVRGGAERQVHIVVDPARLAERNIALSEFRAALRARNRDASGGDFDEGKRRYLVRTLGRFKSVEDIEGVVVARRDGVPVYVRDVAEVRLSRAEQRVQVRHDGEVALAMNVRRTPGTNIIEVMDSVRATVADLNEGLLAERGLILRQVSDDTVYIRDAVAMVRGNLMLGGVLATTVLLLFLRSFTPTLIGAVSVPICTVAAFLGLSLAGRTINVISLAGVAFAIGMTVDNSIVVLENIARHRTLGKSPLRAAEDAVREVWGAVLASTLTTVFVFLPIVLIKEEAGQLFADIAIAITSAIVASMLVAVTVIPTAYSRVAIEETPRRRTRLGAAFQNVFGLAPVAMRFRQAVIGLVRFILGSVWRRVVLVTVMASAAVAMSIALVPQTEYLPEGNKNLLFAQVLPPPGYNVSEMTGIGQRIESKFVPQVGADRDAYAAGETPIPPLGSFFFVTSTQNIFMITRAVEPGDLEAIIPPLDAELKKEPGMLGFATRGSIFGRGLANTRAIDFDLSGTSLEELYDAANAAFRRVPEMMPGARPRPDPGLTLGQPVLEVRPDWYRAAELGVDAGDLGYLVWALTDGAFVDEFFLDDDKIDIFLYSSQGTVRHTQDLSGLLLHTREGGTVPLSSVARLAETVSTETIRRVDRRRTVTLSVTPPPEVALEEAVRILQQEVIPSLRADGSVPAAITMEIGGASDKLAATREALAGNFVLAIIISYLLMVALFSHWGHPLVILTSLPLGITGGLVGLWVLNHAGTLLGFLGVPDVRQNLDVLTMLGFVILVGTVVNNPILIVEQSLANMRDHGMKAVEAVIDSTETRIRPIMMSTLTTVFGLSPLVFLPGAGTELYRGLGTVVLFGLFFSTLFTLSFIPSVLSLALEGGELLERLWARLRGEVRPRRDVPAAGRSGDLGAGQT
jgi:multidrug efflux pump subunit AcrB